MSKATYISFILGAAVGSVATWFYVKKKYEQIAQEEIDSVKEVFSKHKKDTEEKDISEDMSNKQFEKQDLMKYASMIKDENYTNYSTTKEMDKTPKKGPYVISPDEFREIDEYSVISFMYYADHVLCDELDQPVNNIEELIGFESLNHFGEYEDDAVYVRNDERKTDYEILRSLRTYSEVIRENPYKAEV